VSDCQEPDSEPRSAAPAGARAGPRQPGLGRRGARRAALSSGLGRVSGRHGAVVQSRRHCHGDSERPGTVRSAESESVPAGGWPGPDRDRDGRLRRRLFPLPGCGRAAGRLANREPPGPEGPGRDRRVTDPERDSDSEGGVTESRPRGCDAASPRAYALAGAGPETPPGGTVRNPGRPPADRNPGRPPAGWPGPLPQAMLTCTAPAARRPAARRPAARGPGRGMGISVQLAGHPSLSPRQNGRQNGGPGSLDIRSGVVCLCARGGTSESPGASRGAQGRTRMVVSTSVVSAATAARDRGAGV
jgi:hypothetical protein